jgi:hypothetical protein
MTHRRPTKQQRQIMPLEPLTCGHPNAAGVDRSVDAMVVAVPPDRDDQPVRALGTVTVDLLRLADWLEQCGIATVAMESTGVLWIPLVAVVETRGLQAYLVNARQVQAVPRRKSDWNDAQWLPQLPPLGLLRGSFRPDAEMRVRRTYGQQRAEVIQHRAPHSLPMHKVLVQMNSQLPQVLSDITGLTGLAMIRAIVAGEHDPVRLAQLRDPNCISSQAQIAKALTGTWREEHLVVRQRLLALFDDDTALVVECDAHIEQRFAVMKPRFEGADVLPPRKAKQPNSTRKNRPNFNARAHFQRIIGIDLTNVTGLSSALVLTIISESGADMSKWSPVKHIGAWSGLAPRNDMSGGYPLGEGRTLTGVQNREPSRVPRG